MDADRSGLVSLRELKRILCGDTFRTLDVRFDHPDIGITWSLDNDNCVCIANIEEKSPASHDRTLINNLRLYQINDMKIRQYERRSLEALQHELIKIHDEPIELKFVEPLFIITKMTRSLDINVYGKTYSAWLPVGAVNSVTEMEQNIQNALSAAHRDFKHIDVRINRKNLSVTFYCPEFPFSLQFGTGKNFQSSCRYAIGFSAFDTPMSKQHVGNDTQISLNLGLNEAEMNILMSELFGIFDADGSGEFQFEEFRDFHTKLLANEECIETLRSYAKFRFADIKLKAKQQAIFDERRAKLKRRFLLKEKNKEIHDKQHAFRRQNSSICDDGVCRRTYATRKASSIRVKSPNKITGRAVLSAKTVEATPSTKFRNREKMKEKKKQQDLDRQRKLNELADLARQQEKELKRLERDVSQKSAKIHMAEVLHVLRKAYTTGFTHFETDIEGIAEMGIVQNKIITPALKISPALFTEKGGVDDIELEEKDSTVMHPAAGKYFFMRESVREKYNVQCCHPAFFGSDFERLSSRHSSYALGVCRAALSQRQTPMSKVTILKHPLVAARSDEIDRVIIEKKLFNIVSTIETTHSAAEIFVQKILAFGVKSNDNDEILSGSYLTGRSCFTSFQDNEDLSMSNISDRASVLSSPGKSEGIPAETNEEKLSVGVFSNEDAEGNSIALEQYEGQVDNENSLNAIEHDASVRFIEDDDEKSEQNENLYHTSASSEAMENVDTGVRFFNDDMEISAPNHSVSQDSKYDQAEKDENVSIGCSSEASNSMGSNSSDNSDSETEATTNDQSSTSFVARAEMIRVQRANVYNGLNNSLADQLSMLTEQIKNAAKQRERDCAADTAENIEAKRLACARSLSRNALLDGSLSYLRLCGIVVQKYELELKYNTQVFDVDTSSLDTTIHHNTATVLIQAICNFAITRIVEATRDVKNFWTHGTDMYDDGIESEERSSVKLRKSKTRRQGTFYDKIEVIAPPPDKPPLNKRRSGMLLKRLSTEMTSRRESQMYDDDDSTASKIVDPHDNSSLPKNFIMGIHSLSSFEAVSDEPTVLRKLRSIVPCIRARISCGQWKVQSYECDCHRDKWLARQPDLSVGGTLSKFCWSEMDIIDKDSWNEITVKCHQAVHFECTDGISDDAIICEAVLSFQDIIDCHKKFVKEYEDERRLKRSIIDRNVTWEDNQYKPFDVPLTWKCSHRVGDNVIIKGVLKMSIFLNCGDWIFPPRREEYWRSKRSQHWTTYPLVPTSTGVVRQKFRDISTEYDKMKLIHPVFWGFCVRWKGPPEDEVRFIHPMYNNFSMVKKPTSLKALEEIELNARKKIKVNPYKWKPIHECKVCYSKIAGCPRCWEMPVKKNGERCRPVDFQYDPDMELKKANELRMKKAILEQKKQAKIAAMRALRDAGELDYDTDDTIEDSLETNSLMESESQEEKIELHTQLTTEYALELYRKRAQKLMTVYVKITPGGYVRRLIVDPEDSIWHLHNMLRSHSNFGADRGTQFILPTSEAFIQCDADIIPESEFLGARVTATVKLKDYGLRKVGGVITILYLPRYKESTLTPLMHRFMQDNMDVTGLNLDLPVITVLHKIPDALEKDDIQVKLSTIMKRQYNDQEVLALARLRELGAAHRDELQRNYTDFVTKKREEKLQLSREKKEFEKQLQKKLKGLEGKEREEKRRQLMEEHVKASSDDAERKRAAKVKKDAERAEKLRKKRELISRGKLKTKDGTSRVKSAIQDAIYQASESSISKGEYTKNKTVSFVDDEMGIEDSFDESAAHKEKVIVPPLILESKDDNADVKAYSNFEDDLSITSKTFPNLKKNR